MLLDIFCISVGFRELARIPADALKDSIKIKFVNSLGLNEAGIDENGVFKV